MKKQERKAMLAAYLLAAAIAILTALVLWNVKLYGNDYFYGTFGANGWAGFWEAVRAHYTQSNGRTLVHILDALFLHWPPFFWKLLACFTLGGLVCLGTAVVLPGQGRRFTQAFCCGSILAAALLYLDIEMANQSVYWETGFWNYVFPMALLLGVWGILERRRRGRGNPALLCILTLLSAATTEQNAMMTVGLVFLYLADSWWIRREKADPAMIAALIISILGALSVVAAPSQWIRFADENTARQEAGKGGLLLENIQEQSKLFFASVMMRPYHTMALGGTMIFLFAASNRVGLGWNILMKFVAFLGIGAMLTVFAYSAEPGAEMPRHALGAALIFGYELLTGVILFWYMLTFQPEQYYIPLAAVLLALGAQVMMLVSPVFGPRTMLCSALLMAVYAAYMAAHFLPFAKGHQDTRVFLCLLALVMLGAGVRSFWPTVQGYHANAKVDRQNRLMIQQYQSQGGEELMQYQLLDERYGWSMPYNSPYQEGWYRKYYRLPEELPIRWTPWGGQDENQ